MRVAACLLAVLGVFAVPGAASGRALPTCRCRAIADYHPVWSPDDHAIVFESTEASPEIFTLADGRSTSVPLPPATSFLSLSPNWQFVAGVSGGMQPSLVVFRPDGTDVRTLDRNSGHPTWAPNSDRLAYIKAEGESNALYTIRADGSDRRRVAIAVHAMSWAPDGSELAFALGGKLMVAQPDGSSTRRITLASGPTYASPSWSPDGRHIAAITSRGSAAAIEIVRVDGGQPLLIEPPVAIGLTTTLSWAPDSAHLLYSEYDRTNASYGAYEIDLATGTQRHVALFGTDASYSHDGSKIVFGGLTGAEDPVLICVGVGIWVVDGSGGRPSRVTNHCANAPVTISMDAPRELTYGERAQIKGLFLPGFGEFVHGTANPCGRRSSMFVELADQSWSRSIAPTVTTTYTVASDVEQTSATTIVRPAVLVRQTGRHSFQVMVRAGRSLAGKVVTVERFDSSGNGRWVRVGRVKLKRFVAHFRLAPAPLGVSRFVRAILPKSQVGPCYAAATSNELLVTRR